MVEESTVVEKKILIIDDDQDILNAVNLILENAGYSTVTAISGEEGISLANAIEPDLILCDMMMETVDAGLLAAQAIKKSHPAMPVILMSTIAESSATNFDICKQGFSGTIQKPIDPQSIIRAVQFFLR